MLYPARAHVLKSAENLFRRLPDELKSKPQILLLAGIITPFRNDTDREMPFRQESNFYYLTGCVVPSSLLLIHLRPQGGTQEPSTHLFIPEANLGDMMWSIPPPSLEVASQTHEVDTVKYLTALPATLEAILAENPGAIVHTLPGAHSSSTQIQSNPKQFPLISLQVPSTNTLTEAYLLSALHQARLIKTSWEIDAIKRANEISSRAHEVVMRVLGHAVKLGLTSSHDGIGGTKRAALPGEWLIEAEAEAEAIFVASCRREGAVHQAYLPIVASAMHAATLHYCCNDKAFAWGPLGEPRESGGLLMHGLINKNSTTAAADGVIADESVAKNRGLLPQVLLIDAGCEWDCYASDITRTMPVGNGGRFTPEARAIYELVLEMQTRAMELIKPGVHWDTVHLSCHLTLIEGFLRLGLFKPAISCSQEVHSQEILDSGVSAAFFPHGVGHSLGLDVHDVPSVSKPDGAGLKGNNQSLYDYLRLRIPLAAGMVVTVEPGIYFSPHLLGPVRGSKYVDEDVLARFESVGGMRIEDVIVVRDGEAGYENLTGVRSEVGWVEEVCSGKI